MTAFKFTVLVIIAMLCLSCRLSGQVRTGTYDQMMPDSIESSLLSLLNTDIRKTLRNVSLLNHEIDKATVRNVLGLLKDSSYYPVENTRTSNRLHPIIFDKGYINYQWIHRTGLDTPFIETNSSQQLLQTSFSIVLTDEIPIRISYFERHSNSQIFQDFRDLKVEFDAQGFSDIQRLKNRNKATEYENKLRKPFLKPTLDETSRQLNTVKFSLNDAATKKKFIDCKEMLLSPELLDTAVNNKKDSLLSMARNFVDLYERVNVKKDSLQLFYDSLKNVYVQSEKSVKNLRSLLTGRINPSAVDLIKDSLIMAGLSEKDIRSITEVSSPVRTFVLGRTLPNFSNLTLKNTNVKGLNFEYNKNNFYFATAAGKIDFHNRDFIYRGSVRPRQYVYSFRIGYGKKDGSHLIATYYEGQKQISLSSATSTSLVRGSSIAGQLLFSKNIRAYLEFAQSFAPFLYDSSFKSVSKTFNKNNQALNFGFRSFLPVTKTKLEANYTRQGANFQNFAGYRVNGEVSSWYVRGDQDLFKRNVHLIGSIRKNDQSNPFVIRRYNGNTIVRNISASFRNRNFPTITLALMPSSQYTLVENQVYENEYQSFSASVFHNYNIGTSRNTSSLVYTRLNNTSKDSGFIYFNAKNILFNQSFDFSSFIVNSGFSYTANGAFKLTVLQAGLSHKLFGISAINYGFKLNRLNDIADLKFGFFGSSKINIPRIGEFNISMDRNYLPNEINKLFKYEYFTIGFSRYFN